MDTLRDGSTGQDVLRLQARLKELGFSPGAMDGSFGPGTEAAVKAFQMSNGLLADGIVGARTAIALGIEPAAAPASPAMPAITIAGVARMFPVTPLDNIKRNLPPVIEALEESDLTALNIVLMALATIRAETEGFVPINEGQSRFNTSPGGRPFDLYDQRKDLGNQGPPDGERFRGRGFVQLTGRSNYARIGRLIGLADELIAAPEKANDPQIAATILAAFIKDHEVRIKTALLDDDLAAARRLVNGGSHGLDRFTAAYRIGQSVFGVDARV
jgi:peptidoglycan L-alanyl-D-glutamate endopeptidase CwlK